MRHIIFDTENFELLTSSQSLVYICQYTYSNYTDIYKCYRKPSIYKIKIWADWLLFAKRFNCKNVKILSYNLNFFTIGMTVKIDGAVYLLIITPKHKYIIKV